MDITVYHNGFHGDLNETFFIGDVDEEAKKLVQTTYECLMQAIDSGRTFTFMFFDFTDVHCTDAHTECRSTREIAVTLPPLHFSPVMHYMAISVSAYMSAHK